MILTTSRDPSRRTRRFAKVLARFMNWRYVQRGKMSLEDLFSNLTENLVMITEIKANPAFLKIYDRSGKELLSLRINVGEIKKVKMNDDFVVFIGDPPFDPLLLGAMPKGKAAEKFVRKVETKKVVKVRDNVLDFLYDGKPILRIKVLGVRYGGEANSRR
ncbi:rRNA maturation protein [Ferroglobus sp.]|uniref:rRNA maturation protein n=1 Tax=Ferroglobus sp. TaxID=2614230 RepID=UPI0025BDA3C2|nr:rRNA maturation protein [Ferroglobus sp.]